MYIESTNSTNTLLREYIANGNLPSHIYTGYQTAGRGQSGNGWESEKDKNLLCSILLPPTQNLFELNIVTSIAVHRLLSRMGLTDITIKWPNDIYWRDKKLAGILIENVIFGQESKYSIAGIGLNVNQTEWLSQAPNPVSMKLITGKEFNIKELMDKLLDELHEVQTTHSDRIWDYYKTHLYRGEGYWPFVEREVSTTPTMNADSHTQGQFMARIADILPTGQIVLEDQQGTKRTYHFKQIRYVL